MKDRILGCLLASALGDAWGGPWEGKEGPTQFEIPVGPTISDDTQLTVATCESIINRTAVDPQNLAEHFLRWSRAGRIRGMG